MDTNSFLTARTEKQHLRYHQFVCGFYLGLDCGIPILCILVKFTVCCCGTMSSRVKDVSLIGKDSGTDAGRKIFRPIGLDQLLLDAMQAVIFSWAVCSGHNDVSMDVSENSGTPKSSILIGFSIINHPFWGTPIVGNTHRVYLSNLSNYPLGNEQISF